MMMVGFRSRAVQNQIGLGEIKASWYMAPFADLAGYADRTKNFMHLVFSSRDDALEPMLGFGSETGLGGFNKAYL